MYHNYNFRPDMYAEPPLVYQDNLPPPQYNELPYADPQNRERLVYEEDLRNGRTPRQEHPSEWQQAQMHIREDRRRSRSPIKRIHDGGRHMIAPSPPRLSRKERSPRRHPDINTHGNYKDYAKARDSSSSHQGRKTTKDDGKGRKVDDRGKKRSASECRRAQREEGDQIPEFDPALNNISVDSWAKEVEHLARRFDWSEQVTVSNAKYKLAGVARHWYQSQNSFKTWDSFKTKLLQAFPADENYADLLLEMLSIQPKVGSSLVDYYFVKMAALNKCNIKGKKAVDCLLHPIEDKAVKYGAQAARYSEPEHLLLYLKNIS